MQPSHDANARRPIHNWGSEDRTFIAILDRFYNMSRAEQQKTFNIIYRDTLASEGYSSGTYGGLSAQINDLKKGGSGSEHWRMVMQMPLGEAMSTFADQRREIERTAKTLQIGVHPKLVLGASSSERTRALENQKTRSRTSVAKGNDGEAIQASTRKELRQSFVAVEIPTTMERGETYTKLNTTGAGLRALSEEDINEVLRNVRLSPKLRINLDFEGNHAQEHPRLLFRAFEPVHGFRARRFLNKGKTISGPPPYSKVQYRTAVEPHLNVNKTYKSPVISLTESVSYAMRIVDSNVIPARSFAVFDFHDIDEDTKRFGSRCKPRLVPVICKDHQLQLLNGYTGRGEVSLLFYNIHLLC